MSRSFLFLFLIAVLGGCGIKGDPIPLDRTPPIGSGQIKEKKQSLPHLNPQPKQYDEDDGEEPEAKKD